MNWRPSDGRNPVLVPSPRDHIGTGDSRGAESRHPFGIPTALGERLPRRQNFTLNPAIAAGAGGGRSAHLRVSEPAVWDALLFPREHARPGVWGQPPVPEDWVVRGYGRQSGQRTTTPKTGASHSMCGLYAENN
jgi:hypothetical protein